MEGASQRARHIQATSDTIQPVASRTQNPQSSGGVGLVSRALNPTPKVMRGLSVRTKTTWTSLNAGVAFLSILSSSSIFVDPENKEDKPQSTKKTLVVNFLWGFSSCRRGFRLSTNSAFDFFGLNSIRRRPNDSPIFTLCAIGDTRGAHELFLTGEASVFDTDELGRGLLHYACRHGRSEVAKFLISNSVDCHLRSDLGIIAVGELWNYDMDSDNPSRSEIARTVDTFVRDTPFDPFDYRELENLGYGTLTLFNGLPYENLKYLLSQDNYIVAAHDYFFFVRDNLLALESPVDDFQNCLDLLFTKYETMRRDPLTRDEWHYSGTLLQYLICRWIWCFGYDLSVNETKISQCLMLTKDLYDHKEEGTPIDLIARQAQEKVQPWLKILSGNGINISKYLQYESDQHPGGIVYQGETKCCRHISLHFLRGENGITGVAVEDVCDQQYVHFDPGYRCEAGRRRERCITQMQDILVDETGRPLQDIPGGWVRPLKSNSDSFMVSRYLEDGAQYVDFLKDTDWVWDEASHKWTWHERRDFEFPSG